jgi:hypothetical protein
MKFHPGMEVRSTRLKCRGAPAVGVVVGTAHNPYTGKPCVFVDWPVMGIYSDRVPEQELVWVDSPEEAAGEEVES